MALNQQITWALQEAEQRILLALQSEAQGDGWIEVFDEDGNPNVPTTERRVMVFLCGDRKATDPRPNDAAYGLNFGYFDHDKQFWRVHGSFCRYVTHWRECPDDPVIPEQDEEQDEE